MQKTLVYEKRPLLSKSTTIRKLATTILFESIEMECRKNGRLSLAVCERIRMRIPLIIGISEDEISDEEWAMRSNLRNLVLKELILPYFSLDLRLESLGELVQHRGVSAWSRKGTVV